MDTYYKGDKDKEKSPDGQERCLPQTLRAVLPRPFLSRKKDILSIIPINVVMMKFLNVLGKIETRNRATC